MQKMKNWSNHRFGKLKVIKFHKVVISKTRRIYKWICVCDCGRKKTLDISDLKKGSVKSCGCYTKKWQSEARMKAPGIAASTNLYNGYLKNCVQKRGYTFELSKDEFLSLTKQNCYYCGKPPSQIKKSRFSFIIYNGVDRVDNSLGYLKNNVVACCKVCNSAKSGVTKEIVVKVYQFFKEQGKI